MAMLKEARKCVTNEKLHKTENSNNNVADKREQLHKRTQASKKLWVSQNALETAIEETNHEERRNRQVELQGWCSLEVKNHVIRSKTM